jgi:hypothetical protein
MAWLRRLLLLLLFPAAAFGQGYRYDNFVLKPLAIGGVTPVSGALITVCTAAGTGTPCTPKVTNIYSDEALATPITGTGGAGTTNSDANGNFGFYLAPGSYIATVTGSGITSYTIKLTLPAVVSNINNVISVGTTYTTIQACVNAAAALVPPGTCYVPTGTVTTASPSNAACTPSTPGIGNNPCQVLMPVPGGVKLKFGPGKFTNIGTTGGEFIVNPLGSIGNTVECEGRGTTILANNITGSQFTAVYADFGVNNTIKDCTIDSGVNTVQIFTISGNGTTATVTCGDALHATTCGFAIGQAVYIKGSQVTSGSSFDGGPFTVATTSGSTLTYASAINNTAVAGAIANIGNSTSTVFTRNSVRPHLINLEVKHGIVPAAAGGIGNYAVDVGGGFDLDMNDVDFWGGTLDCFSETTNDGSGTYGSITGGKLEQFTCHDSPSNGIDARASGGLTISNAPTGAVENAGGTQATITTTAALSTVNLNAGMCVHITGVTNTAFNGDFIIQQASGSAFIVNNNAPAPAATSGSGQVGLEICNQTWSNITTYRNGSKNTGTDDEYGGTFLSNLAADSSAVIGMAVYNWITYNNFGSGMRLKGDVHNSVFTLNSFQNGYGIAGAVLRDGIALVTGVTVGPHNNIINATTRKGNATNAFSTDASTYNNTGIITTAMDAASSADAISLGNTNDGFLFVNSPAASNGVLTTGALNICANSLTFDLATLSAIYCRSGQGTQITSNTAINLIFNAANKIGLQTTAGTDLFQFSGSGGLYSREVAAPGGAAAFDLVYGDSSDHYFYQNLNNGGAQPIPTRGILTSTYTNATTTASNITGLSFAVAANRNYVMTCQLFYQGSVGTAGLDITITGPAAATSIFYGYKEHPTATTIQNSVAAAFATKLVGAAAVTVTTNLSAEVTLGLRNGANAGTIQVQGSATGAGTVTVQAGSYCTMQ